MKTIKINPIHEAHSALSVVRHVRRISRGGGIKTLTSLARSPLPRSAHRPLCKTRGHRLPAVREIDKFTGSISIVIATYVLSRDDARSHRYRATMNPLFRHGGWPRAPWKVETGCSTPPSSLFSICPSTVFLILESSKTASALVASYSTLRIHRCYVKVIKIKSYLVSFFFFFNKFRL